MPQIQRNQRCAGVFDCVCSLLHAHGEKMFLGCGGYSSVEYDDMKDKSKIV